MSLGSLADDLVRLLKAVYPDRSEAPAIVLVGHSMVGLFLAGLDQDASAHTLEMRRAARLYRRRATASSKR